MGRYSILDLRESHGKDCPRTPFYVDCNLDAVIHRIAMEWGGSVEPYFYYFPEDRESEDYRRKVYGDIRKPTVYESLCAFVTEMEERAEIAEKKEKAPKTAQKAVWHVSEMGSYCSAVQRLYDSLKTVELTSEGMRRFTDYLQEYLSSDTYRKMEEQVRDFSQRLGQYRIRITYDNERILVTEAVGDNRYREFLNSFYPVGEKRMKSPFLGTPELMDLEEEVLNRYMKKHGHFLKEVSAFYRMYENYEDEVIGLFAGEICFYLAFRKFQLSTQKDGFCYTEPIICNQREMDVDGLYDLALACANQTEKKPVVDNCVEYHDGDKMLVVTGPNQGGKTTFARSLGQLVYFAKMGLDVPARHAKLPYYKNILTHFSVEESVETGRGKLKEELVRLSPMMKQDGAENFVIINELFTTAANYDACIMGKRVIRHFVEQGSMGIYVTHLKELADEQEGVVSMRAMKDAEGRQTFKIERAPAIDAANAVNQVLKYRLTYENVKERVGR